MAPAAVSLTEMIDLAIGSPEVGAVNFSVLHSLLHAVVKELGIGKRKAEVPTEAVGSSAGQDLGSQSQAKRRKKKKPADEGSEVGEGDEEEEGERDGSSDKDPIPLTHMPYHKLAEKVNELEKKFEDLESLPSNNELINRGKEADKSRVMSDMWQGMQMSRKVDANTEGISKLMSLTEDLMESLQKLKDENEALKAEMAKKQNADELEELKRRLAELEKFKKDCEDRLAHIEDQIPDKEMLAGFVTWSALEDALKGLRMDLERQQSEEQQKEEEKIEELKRELTMSDKSSTDEDTRRPPSSSVSNRDGASGRSSRTSQGQNVPEPRVIVTRPSVNDEQEQKLEPPRSAQRSSRTSTPGPSPELQELLEKLGKLTNRHDALEVRVDRIEDELSRKLSKEDFDKLGLSSDILSKLNQLLSDIQEMKNNIDRDSEQVKKLKETLESLRQELNKLSEITERLSEEVRENENNVQKALKSCEELAETKADKEYVRNELLQKADKEALGEKLDKGEFKSTIEEIYHIISELREAVAGNEADWKRAIEQLTNELENKADRAELEAMRDELLKQLKALAKRVAALKMAASNDDDAAGIRKQLRFHCISCDKKVDMTPQKPVPSLPGGYALPENRSMKPYLVYELDQIRQYARGMQPGYNVEGSDPYATNRQCGGSHTMTYPHKRVVKTGLYPPYPPYQAFDDNNLRSNRLREEDLDNEEYGQRSRSRSATRLPNVYETSNKTSQPPRVASSRSPHPTIQLSRSASGLGNAAQIQNGPPSSRRSPQEALERSKTLSDIEVRGDGMNGDVTSRDTQEQGQGQGEEEQDKSSREEERVRVESVRGSDGKRSARSRVSEAVNTARSQASEGARSQASEAARSQASEGARSQASEGARSQASEAARSQASEGAKSRSQASDGGRSLDDVNDSVSINVTRKSATPVQSGSPVPDQTGSAAASQSGSLVLDKTGSAAASHSGSPVPDQTSSLVEGQTGSDVED